MNRKGAGQSVAELVNDRTVKLAVAVAVAVVAVVFNGGALAAPALPRAAAAEAPAAVAPAAVDSSAVKLAAILATLESVDRRVARIEDYIDANR